MLTRKEFEELTAREDLVFVTNSLCSSNDFTNRKNVLEKDGYQSYGRFVNGVMTVDFIKGRLDYQLVYTGI